MVLILSKHVFLFRPKSRHEIGVDFIGQHWNITRTLHIELAIIDIY